MNDNISFECVEMLQQHIQRVYAFRSEPTTVQMSCSEAGPFDEFSRNFHAKHFRLTDVLPLFILYEGKRIGYLYFRPYHFPESAAKRICEISIALDPNFRKKGIGTHVLTRMQPYVRERGYEELYAEIKPSNIASRRAFEKAGFLHCGKSPRGDVYRVQLIPVQKRQVFIVAEAGSNWCIGTDRERNLKQAQEMVRAAKIAGCDAIKFQVYRGSALYVPNAGESTYLKAAGIQEDIQTIFARLEMPYDMIPEIAEECKKQHIEFMATAFSEKDFDVIDPYVKRHKIASYEINHIHLIERAAKSQKPTYISTGASEPIDIEWAIEQYNKNGGKELTLLQCTAQYPVPASGMHLQSIPWMRIHFGLPVGLSDHSREPLIAPIAAVALGATVVEKHFTMDRALPGPDHAFAITADELKEVVEAIRTTERMLGNHYKTIVPEEEELYRFARRGMQAISPIKKGDRFQEGKNMAILRPGKQQRGVHPRFLQQIEGKNATRDIPIGDGIQEGDWR